MSLKYIQTRFQSRIATRLYISRVAATCFVILQQSWSSSLNYFCVQYIFHNATSETKRLHLIVRKRYKTANIKNVLIGKAVPLLAWSAPEGSRKLLFPDYMTTEQDGGKFVSLRHRPPLPPGNAPGTHFR